jgi:hypothetical protein
VSHPTHVTSIFLSMAIADTVPDLTPSTFSSRATGPTSPSRRTTPSQPARLRAKPQPPNRELPHQSRVAARWPSRSSGSRWATLHLSGKRAVLSE